MKDTEFQFKSRNTQYWVKEDASSENKVVYLLPVTSFWSEE